jgi:hypothetical protein
MPIRARHVGVARLAAALAVLIGARAIAAQTPLERAVKSVYLFKFADYVEWPPGVDPALRTTFNIGVLGPDDLGATLDEAVKGRRVGGRPIVVRRFDRVAEVEGVDVLYVTPGAAARWPDVLAPLDGRPVLTVGDRSAPCGAIIEFVLHENKVRFDIDATAARRAGLKLSSKLMSLALAVKDGESSEADR